jgi:hypothetical protein
MKMFFNPSVGAILRTKVGYSLIQDAEYEFVLRNINGHLEWSVYGPVHKPDRLSNDPMSVDFDIEEHLKYFKKEAQDMILKEIL